MKEMLGWSGLSTGARTLLLAVVMASGAGWFGVGSAAACKCDKPKEISAELTESAVVFAGKVIKIEGEQVVFDVAMLWKGPKQKSVTVINERSDCMFDFQVGGEYVVYTKGGVNNPTVSKCSRTVAVLQASNELQALGEPVFNPAGDVMNAPEQQRNLSTWYTGLAAALFIMMAYLIYLLVKHKRAD